MVNGYRLIIKTWPDSPLFTSLWKWSSDGVPIDDLVFSFQDHGVSAVPFIRAGYDI